MKKKVFVMSVVAGAAVCLASCNGKGGASQTMKDSISVDSTEAVSETPRQFSFESKSWVQSKPVTDKGEVEVSIKYLVPMDAPEAVNESVISWMKTVLESDSKKTTLPSIVQERGTLLADSLVNDMKTLLDAFPDDEREKMRYAHDTKIELGYEDDECFTLVSTCYVYLGGAHGSTIIKGATFSKADGKIMGWDLLSGYKKDELTREIKKGLKAYFDIPAGADSDTRLFESLMLADRATFDKHFPLPDNPPYLTPQGVCLKYQQYEIACYAAGMPECFLKRR